MTDAPGPRPSRPRNRRALVIEAAAELFYRDGYERVGMNDIAAVVGMTAGALYRHVPGKQQLLAEAILDRMGRLEDLLARSGSQPFDRLASLLATHALDNRELGVLWQREARHLPRPDRTALRRRMRDCARLLGARIHEQRPELTASQVELLSWSGLAVGASVSHGGPPIHRPRFDQLMATAITAALGTPLGDDPAAGPDDGPDDGTEATPGRGMLAGRASRREAAIDAAAVLFARRGYQGVTLEEIGAAIGIAGPSLYNHFQAKADLLDAVVVRATQWLQLTATRSLATATDHRCALHELTGSYVRFVLGFTELVDVLVGELDHLPDDRRRAARQAFRDYLAEWDRHLAVLRPDLEPAEVRMLAWMILTLINDVARTPSLRHGRGLDVALARVSATVLAGTR